jgi:very-short-patch-repair endonuclease
MSEINHIFLDYWNNRFPNIPAVTEFRPQRELYDSLETDLKFKEWCNLHNFSNYRYDFCLRDYCVGAEFDGEGPHSHTGAGAIRDKMKDNQMLKLGYVTLRFPVEVVRESPAYVADEILEVTEVFYGSLQ